jgi:uncharacterized protein YfaA (DUF2138 family)
MSDYAMFTDAGNAAVKDIVALVKRQGLNWGIAYSMLSALSEDERFSEATDTAVRECVYDACGFNSPFYI